MLRISNLKTAAVRKVCRSFLDQHMPIRGLLSFLAEHNLIRRAAAAAALENTTVAFDAVQWIRDTRITADPLLAATGGLPADMNQRIDAELARLSSMNITPIFVFPGSVPRLAAWHEPAVIAAVRASMARADAAQQADTNREDAWKAAADNKMNTAATLFAEAFAPPLGNPETQAAVMSYLASKGVAALRAPGWAAAQCAYLCLRGFAHAAVGGMEIAMFGAPRVITTWQYSSGMIDWVETSAVLTSLVVTHAQFVDACLLAGFSHCTTCPLLAPAEGDDMESKASHMHKFSFGAALETALEARAVGTAAWLLQSDIDAEYVHMFSAARLLVVHHPVVAQGSRIVCFAPNNQATAANISTTERSTLAWIQSMTTLPTSVARLLSSSASHNVSLHITLGAVLESVFWCSSPLPLPDSEEYSELLEQAIDHLRARSAIIVNAALKRSVELPSARRWFMEERAVPLPEATATAEQQLPALYVQSSISEHSHPIVAALQAIQNQHISEQVNTHTLSVSDAIALVTAMTLRSCGAFNTPLMQALLSMCQSQPQLLESCLLAGAYLWPNNMLRGDRMRLLAFGGRSDVDGNGNPARVDLKYLARAELEEPSMRVLVSLAALCAPTTQVDSKATGRVSRATAAMAACFTSLRRAVRSVVESHFLSLLIGGRVSASHAQAVLDRLPFALHADNHIASVLLAQALTDRKLSDAAVQTCCEQVKSMLSFGHELAKQEKTAGKSTVMDEQLLFTLDEARALIC